jgi:glycosyltransferase involved in cell wall biosynthesis
MRNFHPYKIIIIAPTCFYYQAPLFRELAADDRVDLTVYFCSDEGFSGTDVKAAYGANEEWGPELNLLDGYKSKFLRNHAPRGSYLKSLVGLANFGIWDEIKRERPDAVVVMSWMNPTWWLTTLTCLKFQIPMLFMTDANVEAEKLNGLGKAWLKRIFLGSILFHITAGFLCAGTANQRLYTYYGVPSDKLVQFAYSWGYSSLIEESNALPDQKMDLRRKYGLPQDAVVVLYCGRFSPEKGLMELLEAYKSISHPNKALVLVGDGSLKSQMQLFAEANRIDSIYFMGFQTRKDIGKFYALADIFVLPSQRETWGMAVNEALCFSLPVVVSDQVGAGIDLVIPGGNGHVFPAGDVSALADHISKLIELPSHIRAEMGERSSKLITEWSGRDLAMPLVAILDSIYDGRD